MTDDVRTLTNRAIAERAGWTDISEDKARVAFVDSMVLTGIPPSGGDIQVPDYLNSVDAALTLPLAPGYRYDLRYAPGETAVCYVLDEVDAIVDGTGAHDDTPAGVVCAAWWAWMEAQED